MKNRLKTYFKLNSALSLINDRELQAKFESTKVGTGWGTNHVMEFEGKKVFVKRIPLTHEEYSNHFSTKNHYSMPVYYNYGVGSAGFGAWRELITHIKTTNWVLSRELPHFPIMYHYRILPRSETPDKIDRKRHKFYIQYWGNKKEIENYILARRKAKHEIIIFLEHIPQIIEPWLKSDLSRFEPAIKEIKKITDFLKSKEVIHFDLHLHNILVKKNDLFVTDFGLCLDRNFELSAAEKKFFDSHKNYDADEFISCMGPLLLSRLSKLSKQKQLKMKAHFNIQENATNPETLRLLLERCDEMKLFIKLPEPFIRLLKKHRSTILRMNEFYTALRNDHQKEVRYR